MTAERWQRVKQVFETARTLTGADRERVLVDTGDLDLAREVRALLAAYDESQDFMEEPALAGEAEAVAERIPNPLVGTEVGHYRLVREVGQGGMGVVYEAERADGQFEQRVAIKILKRWMLSDVDISRFRSERQILARLDHPHIARLLDGGATPEGIPFYAMEFIDGEFIDDYCRKQGLPIARKLGLFRQVCEAVEYAHQRGVVHRDLKPGNILVTPEGKPKLLDFGIAKVQASGAATLTATVNRAATPYYASPEQLQGGAVTASSDIYSLGVVLYELLAGVHPYRAAGGVVHEVVKAIVEHEPEPPGKVSGERAWTKDLDRIVLKAMQKAPGERYTSAAELSEDLGRYLEGLPVAARSGSVARETRRALRRWWRPAALAAAVITLCAVFWWIGRASPASRPPRRSLAVVAFQNLSGRAEESWIATALAEMTATDLASSERVRVVPAETVDRVKTDLNLPESKVYVRDVLDRLRANLNVDYVVTGSYLAQADALRLDIRLQDARTVQIVAVAEESGTSRELAPLVSEGVGELLRNREWSDVANKRVPRALGQYGNAESARLYAEGRERLRKFDTLGARDLFQKAVTADARNPLAHSALSAALAVLGYEEQARAEAKAAYDLAEGLPREERLSIEARYFAATHNWLRALNAYRMLRDLFPDDADYALRLAEVQTDSGHLDDALATLRSMHVTATSADMKLRIDLQEARAAYLQSKYPESLAAGMRARDTAAQLNARMLAARAQFSIGDALYGLARRDEALAAYRASEAIERERGNTFGIASAILRIGRLEWQKGDYAASQATTERALALFNQIGNKSSAAIAMNNIALDIRGQGDMQGALKMYEQTIALDREVGNKEGLAGALNNAGNLLRRLNRFQEARRNFEECLSIANQLNNREQITRSLITIAQVDFSEGDLISADQRVREGLTSLGEDRNLKAVILQEEGDIRQAQADFGAARKAYEESLAISRELKIEQYAADAEFSLAEITREQGDFAAALQYLSEARAYYTRQKQRNQIFDSELTEARIRLSQGQAAGTEKQIEEAAAGFHGLHLSVRETAAYAALARSWLAQGKPERARAAIDRGRPAFVDGHEFQARAEYRLAAARVTGAMGDRANAVRELEALVSETETKGWSDLAAQARRGLESIR